MEEIKDLLEENGAGHLFKAIKEVFYKYIDRILDPAPSMWPPRRSHQDVDTIQAHEDGKVRPAGRGHQDVFTTEGPPGRGSQKEVTRKGLPERDRQDVVTSKWPPGCGHQDVAAKVWPPERGCQKWPP